MTARVIVFADATLPQDVLDGCQEAAQSIADYAREPVDIAVVGPLHVADVHAVTRMWNDAPPPASLAPLPLKTATMSAAPFVWREDGRPDWAEMWTGFCELALYGGPPHRGEAQTLRAPDAGRAQTATVSEQPWDGFDPMTEIRRGIWETAGLFAEPAEDPGWMVITCGSRKMAAWLAASIIIENVDARCEEERLYVPACRDFHLKNEVKSVITVVAKTHHYWQAHIAQQELMAATAAAREGQRA